MSKSVLVIDTPENCYDCLFGTTYCGKLECAGYCELAYRLNYDVILMTEKHYGRKANQDLIGVHLWICQKKTMVTIRPIHLMQDLQKVGISVLMRLQEEGINWKKQ